MRETADDGSPASSTCTPTRLPFWLPLVRCRPSFSHGPVRCDGACGPSPAVVNVPALLYKRQASLLPGLALDLDFRTRPGLQFEASPPKRERGLAFPTTRIKLRPVARFDGIRFLLGSASAFSDSSSCTAFLGETRTTGMVLKSMRRQKVRGFGRSRDHGSGLMDPGRITSRPRSYTTLVNMLANHPLDEFFRQVQVMSTLPLKAISRLWGKFNELTIPYYLRVPGFRLYAFIFGVK